MRLRNAKSLIFIVLLTTVAFAMYNVPRNATAATSMTAYKISTDITLDGAALESVWAEADALVYSNFGKGTARSDGNITLKFLHNGTHIFFLAEWEDATEHSNRKGWEWNPTTSTYDNLGGNEDRFSFSWAVDTVDMVCGHTSYSGAGTAMLFDVWHWKSTRTNLAIEPWADEKWWNASGRQDDVKSSGGYQDNSVVKQAADNTEITTKLGNSTDVSVFGAGDLPYWYDNGTEIPWASGAVTGATMPSGIYGYNTTRPVGSRGDVLAKGVYASEKWTLEGMREFDTGNVDDILFAEKLSYDFWVAQMDNSGGTHAADVTSKETLYISGTAISDAPQEKTATVVSTVNVTVTGPGSTVTTTAAGADVTVTDVTTSVSTESGYSFVFIMFLSTSSLFIATYVRKIKR
ncbi:MAG: ethylbenzene dehydrogenase-related protein [Candidatus Kariarchaeaceae archaeon]|jgi:hypothetical protein